MTCGLWGSSGRLALGVVLAVDGRPLPGDHAGRQPQPEAEEVAGDRVKVQRPMRLVAVQEDGDAGDGDVGQAQRDQHVTPPGRSNVPENMHGSLVGSGSRVPEMKPSYPGADFTSILENIDFVLPAQQIP
jgi:hypothetical protein